MRQLILLALAFRLCAEDAQPSEVISVMTTYEKGVTAIHRTYEKAEAKIREDALRTLDKAKVDYTKKGDLTGALMVDACMKKMKEGETLSAVEAKMKDGLFTKAPSIVGKWNADHSNGHKAPYVFSAQKVSSGSYGGTWLITNNKLVISWAGGGNDTFDIGTDKMTGVNNVGVKLLLTKVE